MRDALDELREVAAQRAWREEYLGYAFWAMNAGLALMVGLSLLPIGLMQTWASVDTGLWYARSAEFLQTPLLETLRGIPTVAFTSGEDFDLAVVRPSAGGDWVLQNAAGKPVASS